VVYEVVITLHAFEIPCSGLILEAVVYNLKRMSGVLVLYSIVALSIQI